MLALCGPRVAVLARGDHVSASAIDKANDNGDVNVNPSYRIHPSEPVEQVIPVACSSTAAAAAEEEEEEGASSSPSTNVYCCCRTLRSLTLLDISISCGGGEKDAGGGNKPTAIDGILQTRFASRLVDVCANPFSLDDVCALSGPASSGGKEPQRLFQWHVDVERVTRYALRVGTGEELKHAEFGAHPMQVWVASRSRLFQRDLRSNSAPNAVEIVENQDAICALARASASRPFEMYVATASALLLIDSRAPGAPLLRLPHPFLTRHDHRPGHLKPGCSGYRGMHFPVGIAGRAFDDGGGGGDVVATWSPEFASAHIYDFSNIAGQHRARNGSAMMAYSGFAHLDSLTADAAVWRGGRNLRLRRDTGGSSVLFDAPASVSSLNDKEQLHGKFSASLVGFALAAAPTTAGSGHGNAKAGATALQLTSDGRLYAQCLELSPVPSAQSAASGLLASEWDLGPLTELAAAASSPSPSPSPQRPRLGNGVVGIVGTGAGPSNVLDAIAPPAPDSSADARFSSAARASGAGGGPAPPYLTQHLSAVADSLSVPQTLHTVTRFINKRVRSEGDDGDEYRLRPPQLTASHGDVMRLLQSSEAREEHGVGWYSLAAPLHGTGESASSGVVRRRRRRPTDDGAGPQPPGEEVNGRDACLWPHTLCFTFENAEIGDGGSEAGGGSVRHGDLTEPILTSLEDAWHSNDNSQPSSSSFAVETV